MGRANFPSKRSRNYGKKAISEFIQNNFKLMTPPKKPKRYLMKILLLALLFMASCKPPQTGSGGGGGQVPTAKEVGEYIDRLTRSENKTCGDVIIDRQKPRKYPIILPSGVNEWKNDYSGAISKQFDKDYMMPLRQLKLDESDLSLLGCKGYNYATDSEKKQFWILFLAAMTKPESDMRPDLEFNETTGREQVIPKESLKGNKETTQGRADGHLSMGLLQIDPRAANAWCGNLAAERGGEPFTSYDMHTPETNLQCGLLMMQWQIMGVPKMPGMKSSRPDLKGRLFTGDSFWYWSTLSSRNSNGQSDVMRFFSNHAQKQFKFCNRANPIDGYTPGLSSKYRDIKCDEIGRPVEKLNCEKYILNIKIEDNMYNPQVGENPFDESCKVIDNSGRNIPKEPSENIKNTEDVESSNTSK